MNMGAEVVVGRGIKKSSLVISLSKSTRIWKAPFRPIKIGPIRRITKAKSLRSPRATNKSTSMYKIAVIKDRSLTKS